jgi:hypothetical protein
MLETQSIICMIISKQSKCLLACLLACYQVKLPLVKESKMAARLTSIICECKIVATELMIESTQGLQIVVLM